MGTNNAIAALGKRYWRIKWFARLPSGHPQLDLAKKAYQMGRCDQLHLSHRTVFIYTALLSHYLVLQIVNWFSALIEFATQAVAPTYRELYPPRLEHKEITLIRRVGTATAHA